jgi:hypothetical protein
VRFDDCDMPHLELGAGRTLGSIQRADLFGDRRDIENERLVAAVLRLLDQGRQPSPRERLAFVSDQGSKILELYLHRGGYRVSWTAEGNGTFGVVHETGSGGRGRIIAGGSVPRVTGRRMFV